LRFLVLAAATQYGSILQFLNYLLFAFSPLGHCSRFILQLSLLLKSAQANIHATLLAEFI